MKAFFPRVLTAIALLTIFLFLFSYPPPLVTALSVVAILLYVIFFEWQKIISFKNRFFLPATIVYLILPAALIAYMCADHSYRMLIFVMVLLIFANDTGGYVIGSLLGKHKLAPRISPKKTWEGFFGGYLFTLTMLFLIFYFSKSQYSLPFLFLFSFSVSAIATTGDLFESFLKRNVGIKDSGSILPGHGGLLDRFDSFLAVIFLFFALRHYLLKIFNI